MTMGLRFNLDTITRTSPRPDASSASAIIVSYSQRESDRDPRKYLGKRGKIAARERLKRGFGGKDDNLRTHQDTFGEVSKRLMLVVG